MRVQRKSLDKPIDLVIATPRTLLQHREKGIFFLFFFTFFIFFIFFYFFIFLFFLFFYHF